MTYVSSLSRWCNACEIYDQLERAAIQDILAMDMQMQKCTCAPDYEERSLRRFELEEINKLLQRSVAVR